MQTSHTKTRIRVIRGSSPIVVGAGQSRKSTKGHKRMPTRLRSISCRKNLFQRLHLRRKLFGSSLVWTRRLTNPSSKMTSTIRKTRFKEWFRCAKSMRPLQRKVWASIWLESSSFCWRHSGIKSQKMIQASGQCSCSETTSHNRCNQRSANST